MKRRISSIALALTLCLGLLPATAWAAEEPEDKSGGWTAYRESDLPKEETTFRAGEGSIKWEPTLEGDAVVGGTVTLTDATIVGELSGIALAVPYTLVLEGGNHITTQNAKVGSSVGYALYSRYSIAITGGGSLAVECAGAGVEAMEGDIAIENTTISVHSTGDSPCFYAYRGDLTVKNSEVTAKAENTTANQSGGMRAWNGGSISIEDSHVVSTSKSSFAISAAQDVNLINSDVVAIGQVCYDHGGDGGEAPICFEVNEDGVHFQMTGGTLYAKNLDTCDYARDITFSSQRSSADGSAVIYYGGTNNTLIRSGDNIQFADCVYDETSGKVTQTGKAQVSGNMTWNEAIIPPTAAAVQLRQGGRDGQWHSSTLTIPAGTGAEIYHIDNYYSDSKIVNNGALTCPFGISSYGVIEGSGTLNALVMTGEKVDGAPCYTYTAHGDAEFHAGFVTGGLGTPTVSGTAIKAGVDIPANATLTIPQGETLDATQNGVTAANLGDYYTNNGTLVVNGTAIFPANTTPEQLGEITGSGTVIIDGGDAYYGVSVTGGTADKALAKAGETVTLTPGEPGEHQCFKSWRSSDVTVSGNTFTMPAQPVAVTAEYDTVYTVSFDTQGGSAEESQIVVSGQTASSPAADPTREGYCFDGWYADAAYKTPYDFTSSVSSDTVIYAKWLKVLDLPPIEPTDPAPDGTQYQLVMEEGLSRVPAEVEAQRPDLNSVEVIQTALKAELSGIPEANKAVYDVKLMVKVGDGAWTEATEDNFPAGGLTVTLPYPQGATSRYTFQVVHMISMGDQAGTTETPAVTNTAKGIQFTVTSLSPISVGWTAPVSGSDADDDSYAVTLETPAHGALTADRKSASQGTRVTLTVTPEQGYVLDSLTVTGAGGKVLELTDRGGGKYTFQMPGGKVTAAAVFAAEPAPCDGGETCPAHPFADLDLSLWYHDGIHFCVEQGLMVGVSRTAFEPDIPTTRAMLAAILWRLQGSPVVNDTLPYDDVPEGIWYTEAVRWAAAEGIVKGYGDGTFGPDDPITREQLAVMLYRYKQQYGDGGFTGNWMFLLDFTDRGEISDWAYEALCWMTMHKVMEGKGEKVLDPQGPATRAETAALLQRYLQP